jgi:hypothetical protein
MIYIKGNKLSKGDGLQQEEVGGQKNKRQSWCTASQGNAILT